MRRHTTVALASAIALAAAATSAMAAQRVFVSSTGSDANTATNCAPTTPCRSFTAGMTVVDAGGEIVALDAAGYGAVTVTKSVSILANPGFFAGIAASSGNAISIATPGVDVVLRGLFLNGVGAAIGVSMTDGASLTIENCVISNFTGPGVLIATAAAVRITDTVARANALDGVYAVGGVQLTASNLKSSRNFRSGLTLQDGIDTQNSRAVVSDSDLSNNDFGVVSWSSTAAGSARATVVRSTLANNSSMGMYSVITAGGTNASAVIGSSTVTGSPIGINNGAGAVFESQGNNYVNGNNSDTSGVITMVGSM